MQRFGFAILCGVAGFALNSLPEVTLGPLLLGRVVTLPVAILLGPWFGGLAAVIGGAATRGSSLGLIAIILLSLEGVLVGLFSRRGKSPVLAGALVWVAGAAAIVIAPRLYGAGYLRQTILPIALQLPLSGLVAVIVADLVASAVANRFGGGVHPVDRQRLRVFAFRAFGLVATLPVLLLAAVDGQLTAVRREADGGARLREAATALGEHIGSYVNDHRKAVESLASTLPTRPLDQARTRPFFRRSCKPECRRSQLQTVVEDRHGPICRAAAP